MRKNGILLCCMAILFVGCAQEFTKVYKTENTQYKYEYAKECYAEGKFAQAITLLTGLINIEKGTDNAQESLYMLAMAEYNSMERKLLSVITSHIPKVIWQKWRIIMRGKVCIWERLSHV